MDRGTRKRGAEMAIEERGAVMCKQREREEEQMQKRRGFFFFFMNKQMLGIATVLSNALRSTVAIPGNR